MNSQKLLNYVDSAEPLLWSMVQITYLFKNTGTILPSSFICWLDLFSLLLSYLNTYFRAISEPFVL